MKRESIPMSGEQPEVITPEDIKRFRDLESNGFTRHFFDNEVGNHQELLKELYNEAKEKGWEIETITKGRYTYVFTKES